MVKSGLGSLWRELVELPGDFLSDGVLPALLHPGSQAAEAGRAGDVVHEEHGVNVAIVVLHHGLPEALLSRRVPQLQSHLRFREGERDEEIIGIVRGPGHKHTHAFTNKQEIRPLSVALLPHGRFPDIQDMLADLCKSVRFSKSERSYRSIFQVHGFRQEVNSDRGLEQREETSVIDISAQTPESKEKSLLRKENRGAGQIVQVMKAVTHNAPHFLPRPFSEKLVPRRLR